MRRYLVLFPAGSDDESLLEQLERLAAQQPSRFHVLVLRQPGGGGAEETADEQRLQAVVGALLALLAVLAAILVHRHDPAPVLWGRAGGLPAVAEPAITQSSPSGAGEVAGLCQPLRGHGLSGRRYKLPSCFHETALRSVHR